MTMREIPRDEWASFLKSFSLRHQRWLVTLEVAGAEIGAQIKAEQMPLEGITAELNRIGEDIISILVGSIRQQRVTHIIHAPMRVRLNQTEAGADEALEIESAGSTTVVRFRSAVLPEMVDGIL